MLNPTAVALRGPMLRMEQTGISQVKSLWPCPKPRGHSMNLNLYENACISY